MSELERWMSSGDAEPLRELPAFENTVAMEVSRCPFCGLPPHPEVWIEYRSGDGDKYVEFAVQCSGPDCEEAQGPVRQSKEEAVAAWNRRAPAWIPTSERLPEQNTPVLVWSDHHASEAQWREMPTGQKSWISGGRVIFDPSHWQPLPAPPEDKT